MQEPAEALAQEFCDTLRAVGGDMGWPWAETDKSDRDWYTDGAAQCLLADTPRGRDARARRLAELLRMECPSGALWSLGPHGSGWWLNVGHDAAEFPDVATTWPNVSVPGIADMGAHDALNAALVAVGR
ncbi:hypothetical protein HN937_25015 [Candidatus Poribacteria bacterium]|jgi:hypothetical protein|nr:hypothetical protein [Candidatus Poribacteria bacterium]